MSLASLRPRLALCLPTFALAAMIGCGGGAKSPVDAPPQPADIVISFLADEVPEDVLDAVMHAHHRGLGSMEQFKFRDAVDAFREVQELSPEWTGGAVNLAIALLHENDAQTQGSEATDGSPAADLEEAQTLLDGVLNRYPNDPRALFCKGVILTQQGDSAAAHALFRKVAEIDPLDPAAWLWAANTVASPQAPSVSVGDAESRLRIELLRKALEINPALVSAIHPLAFDPRGGVDREERQELLDRGRRLDPGRAEGSPGPGDVVAFSYGLMGRYGQVVSPLARPEAASLDSLNPPQFEAPESFPVKLAAGLRWSTPADFTGDKAVVGRIRERFGAAVVVFDVDGDGRLDVFLAAALVGPTGPRDALLLNRGDAGFEDATASFGLPDDRASTGAAVGDFDADRRPDLYLTGLGGDRLLRNVDGKAFEDLTESLQTDEPPMLSLTARWLDLDQDGDLDLYVVNHTSAEHADDAFRNDRPTPPGVQNGAYRNDGRPPRIAGEPESAWSPVATADVVVSTEGLSIAMEPWPKSASLRGGPHASTGIAFADFDDDRDMDLILTADDAPPIALLNERLGVFRAVTPAGLVDEGSPLRCSSLLVVDLDGDGLPDLAAPGADGLLYAWRNVTPHATAAERTPTFKRFASAGRGWRTAAVADLDLDGRFDLVGARFRRKAEETPQPPLVWVRNEGARLIPEAPPILIDDVEGFAIVDLVGDPLPDLFLVPTNGSPKIARNLGNGNHWLALELAGRWRGQPQGMRTDPHGLGARLMIKGRGIDAAYHHGTPVAGLGSAPSPVVIGLKDLPTVDLLQVVWPDGVRQAEWNVAADQRLELAERNRSTYIPIRFTWNGGSSTSDDDHVDPPSLQTSPEHPFVDPSTSGAVDEGRADRP